MNIQKKYPLQKLNSFGLESYVEEFVEVSNLDELREIIALGREMKILGGGSNILLSADVKTLLVKNNFKGIEVVKEAGDDILVKAAGGENWHELVIWCIARNYCGIENLYLIPGTVGAAPIQNIGAYGVELKDVFYELEAVDLKNGAIRTFNSEDCKFGYRDSVFKQELKGKYFISSVTFKLSLSAHFKIAYGDLKTVLGDNTLSLKAVSDAVIKIRTSKLPNPAEIGNAGSFFKNPVIPVHQFRTLLEKYPELPSYPAPSSDMVKIPAGWLIEKAGWKGYQKGNIGVHEKQALVLVNYGGGKGSEIYQLALDIKADVFEKFGVEIEPEVNIW
jgi:UDP-N-acetylmuramate dehydrogenase